MKLVPSNKLDYWATVAASRAVVESKEELVKWVEEGSLRFVAIEDDDETENGAIFFRFAQFDSGLTLYIDWLTYDGKNSVQVLDMVDTIATLFNADHILFSARLGFDRKYKELFSSNNYLPVRTVYKKDAKWDS